MNTQPWYLEPVPSWVSLSLIVVTVFVSNRRTHRIVRAVMASALATKADSVQLARHAERMLEDMIRIEPDRADTYDLARVDLVRYRERAEVETRAMNAICDGAPPWKLARLTRELMELDRQQEIQRDQEPPTNRRAWGLGDTRDD